MNEMEEIIFSEKFKIKIQTYLILPKDYKIQLIPPNTFSYRMPNEYGFSDIQLNQVILANITGTYAAGFDSRTNTLLISLIEDREKSCKIVVDEYKGLVNGGNN